MSPRKHPIHGTTGNLFGHTYDCVIFKILSCHSSHSYVLIIGVSGCVVVAINLLLLQISLVFARDLWCLLVFVAILEHAMENNAILYEVDDVYKLLINKHTKSTTQDTVPYTTAYIISTTACTQSLDSKLIAAVHSVVHDIRYGVTVGLVKCWQMNRIQYFFFKILFCSKNAMFCQNKSLKSQ